MFNVTAIGNDEAERAVHKSEIQPPGGAIQLRKQLYTSRKVGVLPHDALLHAGT
jgi:hypothetical protein